MTDILAQIVDSRRRDYAVPAVPMAELRAMCRDRTDFRPFREALRKKASKPGVAAVIAEIKRGSPSKGMFAPNLDPVLCAAEYETGGAACLSVLTEPKYFFGTLGDLTAARQNTVLPVLRKDFIVSEYQVYETALYADCMLLIARSLEAAQLKDLYSLAAELQLDVLVEVCDEADIEKIAPFRFPLVGINHRNLATMDVDMTRSQRLAEAFTPEQHLVAASGIFSRDGIDRAMSSGITSFLIGESLSRKTDRAAFLRELTGE
ncbi:MAG: indole-3-glycerol phosphate synthase TrpC [Planctomycetaceae bacterium]|jgi:indole-3-glycerol phosphate synthase|nr:indole-3-glycerol phosphate synthase TrpC [Planctomycetaceae bacterium]